MKIDTESNKQYLLNNEFINNEGRKYDGEMCTFYYPIDRHNKINDLRDYFNNNEVSYLSLVIKDQTCCQKL